MCVICFNIFVEKIKDINVREFSKSSQAEMEVKKKVKCVLPSGCLRVLSVTRIYLFKIKI